MARKVIGIHSCNEVLKVSPHKVSEIILRKGFEKSQDLQSFEKFAKTKRIKLSIKDPGFLDKIAPSHQGVCVMVEGAPELDYSSISKEITQPMILLALDEISDPHNVGAMMRTSWLLGVKALIATKNRSAHLTPSVSKVACGGAEHVPLEIANNLVSELQELKDQGFWVFGLSGEGTKSLTEVEIPEKVVWVVGSEESGLRTPVARACDELISIPQVSAGPSYNASVAVGMALFESARQHQIMLSK